MGKTGARKRVANKLGEEPFNVEDRIRHQIRKKDQELLNMYHWHVEQMQDLQEKTGLEAAVHKGFEEADKKKLAEATEIGKMLAEKDAEITVLRASEDALRKKLADAEENTKILAQAKDLIQIMLAHHYCYSKKNVWIVNQAQNIGVVDADEYNDFADALEDGNMVEKILVNPVLDLIMKNKVSKNDLMPVSKSN